MCNNCQNSNNNCGCSQTTVIHNNCNTCPSEPCACPVMLTTNCVTYNGDDLACSGIEKNTNLTETIQQLDEFICETKDQLYNAFSLVNIGTGSQVYKGVDGIGRKELRTLLGGSLIDVTQGTNDITLSVDEAALNTFIENNQKTYSITNVGTGAGVYKNLTVVGDNTQFNLRKIKSSDSSITITEGTDDIDLISAVSISVPDATATVKGILKLTNDLGGTADLPTTPTALHITTDESWTGVKSSTNTGIGQINGLNLTNNGTSPTTQVLSVTNTDVGNGINIVNISSGQGLNIANSSSGEGVNIVNTSTGFGVSSGNSGSGLGIYANNSSTGYGIASDNSGTGRAFSANNSSTGISIYSNNQAAGHGIVSSGSTPSTGFVFIGRNVNSNTFTVDKLGNINANSYIKTGGTSSQYLMADGSVKEENLQKVIIYPTDFTGTNYTLTDADNNYEIIIDNGATAVSITVPSGLVSKIGVGFTQKGTGDVSYVASGTTINNPIGLKIKGQYYQTYLSQELSTNSYYLGGNTKL